MSTFFEKFALLEAAHYQGVVILALIGLAWAAGWLVIDKIIPGRWKTIAQIYVIVVAVVLCVGVLFLVGD